jgi:ketosteroid isomerase-like protein
MRLPVSALLAACALLAFNAVPLSAGEHDARSAFEAGTDAWIAAYNAGDADRIIAMYTEDAIVQPPDHPAIQGHAALRDFLVAQMAASQEAGLRFTVAHTGSGSSGNLGWHSGTFAVMADGGDTVGTGKFLEVWERRDGKWLMVRDAWNNDAAAAD